MLVGFAFALGFAVAWLIYRNGLAVAEKLAAAMRPVHTLLIRKFYFDEAYGLVLVGGLAVLRQVCYAFDKYVIDGLVNLSARVTRVFSWVSGMLIDQRVVDGAVNGVGAGTYGLGGLVRTPQDGRIRNYVLFAGGGLAVVAVVLAWQFWSAA